MKRTLTTIGALMAWTTTAMAAGGMEAEGTSIITMLLLGFGALIVAAQLIPAVVILRGMVKGLLRKAEVKTL